MAVTFDDVAALNLAKAIRDIETGNDPTKRGGSGEIGKYQWMPATWKSAAKEFLGDENAQMTPYNEDLVAYQRIKKWKDQEKLTADQIAGRWNSGRTDWAGIKGVNDQGVAYDTPAYVNKVYNKYLEYKGQAPVASKITPPTTTQPGGNRVSTLDVVKQYPSALGETIVEAGKGAIKGLANTGQETSNILNKIKSFIPENLKQQLKIQATTNPVLMPIAGALELVTKVSPAISKIEESRGLQKGEITKPIGTAQKVGFYAEKVGELLTPMGQGATIAVTKKPLTIMAEKLYQSAMKPKDIIKAGKVITSAEDIVRTGLKERIWLTQGGVEKVANKIDEFESLLGDAIEKAKNAGKKISSDGMKSYLDEAKKFFENQVDVEGAEKAIKEIEIIGKNFIKKYGKEIPIEVAQEIKVNTGRFLRTHYDKLSAAGIEGQKQATRFLKEEIVKNAPIVGNINKRLSSLYQFDNAIGKATNRIKNLNLLGLGTKFGAAARGRVGATVGLITDLMDAPAIKSGVAIGLNELGNLGKAGAIPINTLLGLIRAKIEENQ